MFDLSFKKKIKSIGCLVWPVEFFENGGARRKNAPTLIPLGELIFLCKRFAKENRFPKGIRVGANFSTTTQFSKNSTGHENCRIAFIFLLNVAPNSLVMWKNSEIERNGLRISPGARKFFS